MAARTILLSLLPLALALAPRDAPAQDTLTTEYAVKVLCGAPQRREVAPGTYFTAINIHNPNADSVALRKKFALTLPGERGGRVYPFSKNLLLPDQALEIDCTDIQHRTGTTGFLKGFAVIQSPQRLDIVAVYSAAGATGRVETLALERVPGRSLRAPQGLPDLVPVPDRALGFCRRDSIGLLVTVRNQGVGTAPASVTTVAFSPGGTVSVNTPPIGSTPVTLPAVAIPAACFDPDCDFRITVDATAVVVESNEANNVGAGSCIG